MTFVNHGRWIVNCSTKYCDGARLAVDAAKPCSNCGCVTAATFPADKQLIDAALARRIVPDTRNWLPGETVNDLVAENETHSHEGVTI